MSLGNTYSFKDLVGSIVNPAVGFTQLLSGGGVGFGAVRIIMTTDRTTHDIAADGTVMPSYLAGDNGVVEIEIQQTSPLHKAILGLYNACVVAANADDLAPWAATQITFRTLLDGSFHSATGCSFEKIPDKPYQAQGQKMTWRIMSANIVNS